MDTQELFRKAMSEAAKIRWSKTSAKERSEISKRLNEARWAGKTKAERQATAKKAAAARWSKSEGTREAKRKNPKKSKSA